MGCCSVLEDTSRIVFQPVTQLREMEAKLIPWGQASADLKIMNQVAGRGLHSSTFRLNVSTFCVIGGASRGCLGVVWGVFRRCQGILRGM
jgi:hypothetical protein